MAVVSCVQMYSESGRSETDALSAGIRAIGGALRNARDRQIRLDSLSMEPAGPGRYRMSVQLSIEVPGSHP